MTLQEPPGQHRQHPIHPPSHAGILDSRIRWYLYRPDKLAGQYIRPGQRVLDFGCGPGFFTREFAKRVSEKGQVISVDLQPEMLSFLKEKMKNEGLLSRIRMHRCLPDSLNLSPELDGKVDAAFALFVVHEVPDPDKLFREIAALLRPGGIFFFSEPVIVVNHREIREQITRAERAGLHLERERWYFLNRGAVFRKA